MKKILVISAVFPPEPIVSSKLSFDIVNALAGTNRVTVLHPRPTRPYGFTFDEEILDVKKYEDIALDSYTCPQSNLFGRIFESFSFGQHCKRYIKNNKDDIFCVYLNVWPLFSQALIVKTAKKYSIPCIIHVQDIYPESYSNKVGSILISKIIRKTLLPIDQYILDNVAHILAISINMKQYLSISRGIKEDKITIVENWQDEDDFIAFFNKREKDDNDTVLTFMYLGNIGPIAGVDFLITSFAKAKLNNAKLVIAGNGSCRKKCMDIASSYNDANVEFWDVPNGNVPEIQNKANVMLLPVKKGAAMSSIPSKLPAYMFSKKAIIGALDLQSDTAKAILEADCGIVVHSGNEDEMVNALQKVAQNWTPEILDTKGKNGYNYAMLHFSKKFNLPIVTKMIEKYVS